ncbi:MAG: glycosyltransferase family 2 protein [Lachnospiraceae bacterium]|nr:glycosyltransferase family 2 protein [Lachnospiraceae bacterium]
MDFNYQNKPGQKLEKQCVKTPIDAKVSIVTPYYNSGKNFEETYNCVINQSFEAFEWIIVDDGSTDIDSIKELERLAATDARIFVYRQDNGGQSKAKNYALQKSNTDIIVFLDADDLVEPFYVEYLYRALEMHPKAGWSYMDLVGFGAVEYVWCKNFSTGRMTFNNILVNSAAFRKSCLKKVGWFPEVEKYYDEDWALYLKLLAEQVHPVHIPVIGFWYRKSQTGMQQTVRKNEALRKASDEYIAELAKVVKCKVKAECYAGELPEQGVRSEYSVIDKIIAVICNTKLGCFCMKKIYRLRSN